MNTLPEIVSGLLAALRVSEYEVIEGCEGVKSFLEKHKGKRDSACLVWFRKINDPVYSFWLLCKNKALFGGAFIVFDNANRNDPEWKELRRVYGGVFVGGYFVMEYDDSIYPPVLPSQRELFLI
ncbi:MAG: hypothetical protein QXT73_01165 [Candidatus Methanomethylicaceae archaeon]